VEKNWVIPIASAVPILAIIYAFSLGPMPQKVLRDSIDGGDPAEVVPVLVTEMSAKDMARRRYAVEYLGRLKDSSALPALEAVLTDAREADYLRADALTAIHAIDRNRAHEHAITYRESTDDLGRQARELLAAKAAVVGALQ